MELFSKEDAANLLGVTVRTIDNHIATGLLPAPKALGRRVYWLKHEFETFILSELAIDSSERPDINI